MLALYTKLVDKYVSPEAERKLHLGRRRAEERRQKNTDRRNGSADDFRYSQSERRKSDTPRRDPNQDERRQRWFRINTFQSRHLL